MIEIKQETLNYYRSLITGGSSYTYDSEISQLRNKLSLLERTPGGAVEASWVRSQLNYYEELAQQARLNKSYQQEIDEIQEEIDDLIAERDWEISKLRNGTK